MSRFYTGVYIVLFALIFCSGAFCVNLLDTRNPGFENANPGDYWTMSVWGGTSQVQLASSDPTLVHSGAKSWKFNGDGAATDSWQGGRQTSITVSDSKIYQFKIWVKAPTASPSTPMGFAFRVNFGTGAYDVSYTQITTSDWIQVKSPLIQPTTGTTYWGYVGFHTYLTGGKMVYYVDDCSIEEMNVRTVSGRVTDGTNGISGASVCLNTDPAPFATGGITGVTDSNGYYSMPAPEGSFYIAALSGAYRPKPSADTQITQSTGNVPNVNFALTTPRAPVKLVDLKASGLTDGTLSSWSNLVSGTGGVFTPVEGVSPVVGRVDLYRAVTFNVTTNGTIQTGNAMRSDILAPSALVGKASYTVASWLYIPTTGSSIPDEQAYMCWARRFPAAPYDAAQFGYGKNAAYGAVSHTNSAKDMGFAGGPPAGMAWHHVAVTYDGIMESVYVDGVMNSSQAKSLNIVNGDKMMIGAAFDANGLVARFNGSIASLEVYDDSMTPGQVALLAASHPPIMLTYTISGAVTDGSWGIDNCDVAINLSTASDPFVNPLKPIIKTDAYGSYSFTIEPGTYKIAARKFGYITNSRIITISSNMTGQNVVLAPYQPLVKVDADQVGPGVLSQWPNLGSLGGNFVLASGDLPQLNVTSATLGGISHPSKCVIFNGNSPLKLVDSSGHPIDAATNPVTKLLTSSTVIGTASVKPVYTMAAWIYRSALTLIDTNIGFCSWAPFGSGANFQYGGTGLAADHYLAGWNLGYSNVATNAPAGAWNHILFTSDGATEKVFINGVLNNSASLASVTPGNFINSGAGLLGNSGVRVKNPFYIGAITWNDAYNFWTDRAFKGSIASLLIYDKAINDIDVPELMNGTAPPLTTVYTISGTVRDTGGQTQNGAVVSLYYNGNFVATCASGTAGEYSFTVSPGIYSLLVAKPLYLKTPSSPTYADATYGNVSGVDLTLAYREAVKLVDVNAVNFAVNSTITDWNNTGVLGGTFKTLEAPAIVPIISGYRGVYFNGSSNRFLLRDQANNIININGVIAPDRTTNAGNSPWTVAAWVFTPSIPASQCYFTWGPHGNVVANGAASAMYSSTNGAFWTNGTGNVSWDSIPTAGQWHFLTVTYDGYKTRVYSDGLFQSTVGSGPLNIPCITRQAVQIGARYWEPGDVGADGGTSPGDWFTGAIARLFMYDDALPGDRIISLLSSSVPPTEVTKKIYGNVTSGGSPVNGATVRVKLAGTSSEVVLPATTNASGYYEVNVGAGSYDVEAWKAGYITAKATAAVSDVNVQANLSMFQSTAGPVVDIDANDLANGVWPNKGLYGGSFTSHAGTLSPAAWIGQSGQERKGVTFDGSQFYHLENAGSGVPAMYEITGASPWTVLAWVYDPAPLSSTADQRDYYFSWAPLGYGNGAAVGLGWQVWGSAVAGANAGTSPFIDWPGANATFATAQAQCTAPWGRWAQVVTTYDGTTVRVYVDAVEKTAMAKAFTCATTSGRRIYLGGAAANGDADPGRWGDTVFSGSIARLKMYAYALNQTAITADFNNPPPIIQYLTINVSDSGGAVANALVRIGGTSGTAVVTGSDGKALIPLPSAGTYELYTDAAGHSAVFQNVVIGTTNQTANVTLPVDLSEPGVFNGNFASGSSGWQPYTELSSGWTEQLGNTWPAPNSDMYSFSVSSAVAGLAFGSAHPRPGVTWPLTPHTYSYTGTITALTQNTLTDTAATWTTLNTSFSQYGDSVEVVGSDGKTRSYPIRSFNTTTHQITLVSGATLVTDGLAVGSTYKVTSDVHRWWYPGYITPTSDKRITVNPCCTFNFYFKMKSTINQGQPCGVLLWRDSGGNEIKRDVFNCTPGSTLTQFIPVVMAVPPANAATVEPLLGIADGSPLAEYYTKSGGIEVDDIVVDPVTLPSIKGTVTLADGLTPINGASVAITGGGNTYKTKTGSDGTYSVFVALNTTYTVSAAKGGYNTVTSAQTVPVASGDVTGVNFILTPGSTPQVDQVLFAAVTDSLPASGQTGNWNTFIPLDATLTAMGTPAVTTLSGAKWEENLYADGDGFRYTPDTGAEITSPIACNGATIVVAVKPVRNSTGTTWNSLVDCFYNSLVLGIRNNTGEVTVHRNGTLYSTGAILTDGRRMVLSLVVQPDGTFKVFADGSQIAASSATSAFTQLTPGTQQYSHYINIGRNYPDGWTTFNGNIGDVYVYKTALNDTDRSALESSIRSKFNLVNRTITASAGAGGSISPSGSVSVLNNDDITFTITPQLGYRIQSVLVDGVSQGVPGSYTFVNVTADHTISAAFSVQPPAIVSGRITDQTSGVGLNGAVVYFSTSPNASVSPAFTAIADSDGNYAFPLPSGTWYICASEAYHLTSADISIVLNGTDMPNQDLTLAQSVRNIPAKDKLLFSCVTESFPASGATGAWPVFHPRGVSALSIMGSPTVQIVDGVKMEQNLYADGDGYNFGAFNSPISCSGATIVAVVQPQRNAIHTAWNSIVDIFYSNLVLGIHNETGELVVARNSVWNSTGFILPDGQKTILALLVQPDGTYKLYANGIEASTVSTQSDYVQMAPGGMGFMHNINVGRNQPDGWTAFNGNIGDVFVYKAAIPTAQLNVLQADLGSKFNIIVDQIPAYSTISGRVLLEDGITPVEGVTLRLNDGSTATTDSQGRYSFTVMTDPISGMTYVLRLGSKAGYAAVGSSVMPIVIFADPIVADFTMTELKIIGIVKTAAGTPIYNAVVQAGGYLGAACITGADGKFSVSYSETNIGGSIELYADALGYADSTVIVPIPAAGSIVSDMVLDPKVETGVIKNGGFENGISDWTASTGFNLYADSTTFTSGSSSGRIEPDPAYLAANTRSWNGVYQDVPVIPGSVYNFYYKTKATGPGNIFPKFSVQDENHNDISAPGGGVLSSHEWGWVDIRGWVHTADADWTQYYLGLSDWGNSGPMVRMPVPDGAKYIRCFFTWPAWDILTLTDKQWIDDVVIDRVGPDVQIPVDVNTIQDLRSKQVDDYVKLNGTYIVTLAANLDGLFYICDSGKLSGLRCVKAGANVSAGTRLTDLVGTVKKTLANEVYLELDSPPSGTAGDPVKPYGMNNKAVSSDLKAQTLPVKTWGKVMTTGSDHFTITDGYSAQVTVMLNGGSMPALGSTVVVCGVPTKNDSGQVVVLLGSIQ